MAITVSAQITGQNVGSSASYCYLYEPLFVSIEESDLTAEKIYIDLELTRMDSASTIVDTLFKYAEYDINSGNPINIDLMRLARQYHDSNIYKIGTLGDLENQTSSATTSTLLTEYRYNFKIYSDKTPTFTNVVKVPIIGGRGFEDFNANVFSTTDLTELEVYTETDSDLASQRNGYPTFTNNLFDDYLPNLTPNISYSLSNVDKKTCVGMLVWKSKYGGWLSWGFDSKQEKSNIRYEGNIEVGMFEPTGVTASNPYVESNYTGISTTKTITLNAYNLTLNDLRVLNGLNYSPAIYYLKEVDSFDEQRSKLELMRLTSTSPGVDTLTNGGNFSATLRSISITEQNTR